MISLLIRRFKQWRKGNTEELSGRERHPLRLASIIDYTPRPPAIQQTLDEIDRIPWQEYYTVFGPATYVRQQLWNLTADDPERANSAAGDMIMMLIHQYDLVPCWVVVPPFLIRFLQQAEFSNKEAVLELLSSFMYGYTWWAREPTDLAEGPANGQRMDEDARLDTLLEELYKVIQAGLPLYLRMLETLPRPVPYVLIALLGSLRKDVSTIAPKLWDYFVEQGDPTILGELENLVEGYPEYYPWFEEVVQTHPQQEAREAAAASLAYLLKAQTPQAAIALLTAPTLERKLNWQRINALRHLAPEQGVPTLLKMLNQAHNVHDAHELVRTILTSIFPEAGKNPPQLVSTDSANYRSYISAAPSTKIPPPKTRAELSDFQVHTIRVIVECDRAWRIPTDLWELYGVPSIRHELRKLVS